MNKRVLLAWVVLVLAASNAICRQQTADEIMASVAETLRAAGIESGMIVTSASTNGPGYRAGLRIGDLVVKINDEPVTDTGSFATLRDHFRGSPAHFTVWRDGSYLTLPDITMPAAVSVSGIDWSYAMAQILMKIDTGDAAGVRKLIQEDEAAHRLSHKDLLIAKLLILPTGPLAPGSEQEKLTNELAASLSPNDCIAAASSLQAHGRTWSSMVLQRIAVTGNPENVNLRLNLAQALARFQMNDEAEQNVRYILDKPNPHLSNYGYSVAENVLAMVATNRGQNEQADLHRQRASVYAAAPANTAPALPPFRSNPTPKPGLKTDSDIPPELAKQLKSAADDIWLKWMKTGDIRGVDDVRVQSVRLQNPSCAIVATIVSESACTTLTPEERLDLYFSFENTMGLLLHSMIAQDIASLEAKETEIEKFADSIPGAEPTSAQLFAIASVLFGPDVAAPLTEIAIKASSAQEARQQLSAFKRVESIVKTTHLRTFEETLDTYNKNVQQMDEKSGELDVTRQSWDPDFGLQFGLEKDVPIYWVRKDLHEFIMAVVDGEIKFLAASFVTK